MSTDNAAGSTLPIDAHPMDLTFDTTIHQPLLICQPPGQGNPCMPGDFADLKSSGSVIHSKITIE